jgi:membrane-bound serine protease (ClpP class)
VRRLPIAGPLVALAGLVLSLLIPLALPAWAGEGGLPPAGHAGGELAQGDGDGPVDVLDVVKVDGLLDPVMVDFVVRSLASTRSGESVGVLLQVDSDGAVVDTGKLRELLSAMDASSVPVSVWIGPSGSTARGLAALLGAHADRFGMAPGSTWGLDGEVADPVLLDGAQRPVPDNVVEAQQAIDTGLVAAMSPTIGDLIVDLPGMRTREVDVDGETRREPVTAVRFSQLPLLDSLMHAVASPAVAYLLLTVGMALLIFELFTAGVGVAGGVAAGSLLLGCYGLAVLPAQWWAVGLLVLSMVAFAIDVQTGVPRFWTGVGLVLYVAGSLTLYDGLSLSWITLVVAVGGVALTFVSGIPSMVRTRFATPTIGREWMVGELGRAVTSVDPDGVVQVRQALWRATTNRATPIEELDQVRVVGIDGLVLEVEPEEGGARDYREMGRNRSGKDGAADTGEGTDQS